MKNELENQTTERLPKGWTQPLLEDLVDDRGISYGIVQPGSFDPNGVPVIRVNNIREGQIRADDVLRVEKNIEEKYTRTRLRGGEVLLTLVGSLGECAIVPKTMKGWNVARAIAVIPVREEIGNRWVAFVLRSLKSQHYIQTRATTTVQATLNLGDLVKIPIPLPQKQERDFIAYFLGTFDDKIELNRKINETLETMARAIFRSWFVDFDPVRAKAEGRQPEGMDAATAALFPSEFEEVDGREVPMGWGVGTIGESTTIVGGSTPSTTNPEYWENGTHLFATPKDLARLSTPILLDTEKKITDLGVSQISSRILPVGTVLLSSRAPIGYIVITTIPVSINQGFIAIICDKDLPNYYMLSWVRVNLQSIIDRANGTTFLEISKSNFKPMEIVIPPKELLNKFVQLVKPLFSQVENNEQQSKKLAQSRDTLLPKLMSGEIPI